MNVDQQTDTVIIGKETLCDHVCRVMQELPSETIARLANLTIELLNRKGHIIYLGDDEFEVKIP